jgi:hypothetical protein
MQTHWKGPIETCFLKWQFVKNPSSRTPGSHTHPPEFQFCPFHNVECECVNSKNWKEKKNSSLSRMQTQKMPKLIFFCIFPFLRPLFFKGRILDSELFFPNFGTPWVRNLSSKGGNIGNLWGACEIQRAWKLESTTHLSIRPLKPVYRKCAFQITLLPWLGNFMLKQHLNRKQRE